MTAEETPSSDEDHVIWMKAPEKASELTLSWHCLVEIKRILKKKRYYMAKNITPPVQAVKEV